LIHSLDDGIVSSSNAKWKRGKNIITAEQGALRILSRRFGESTKFGAFRLDLPWHGPRTSVPTKWMGSRSFGQK
jgi:hypothetical protein